MRKKSSLLIALPLFLLILVGTLGFYSIENWSIFDSLYMTVTTLTTVGYQEIHSLSKAGKIFNMLLILLGAGAVTYSISVLITEITSYDFKARRKIKMNKKINNLKNHTIVCGYGRMGEVVCKELSKSGIEFIVIEKRQDLIKELEKTDFLFIDGDAAADENLIQAKIEMASVLVSAIDNDPDGLYITIVGKSINPNLFIVTRANDLNAKKRMLRAGANKVVLPFVMTGQKVAESVINPAVEDIFDLTGVQEKNSKKIQLADLFVTNDSIIKDFSIRDKGEMFKELIIIGVRDFSNEFHFRPKSSYIFKEGDCLVTMGPVTAYEQAKTDLGLSSRKPS